MQISAVTPECSYAQPRRKLLHVQRLVAWWADSAAYGEVAARLEAEKKFSVPRPMAGEYPADVRIIYGREQHILLPDEPVAATNLKTRVTQHVPSLNKSMDIEFETVESLKIDDHQCLVLRAAGNWAMRLQYERMGVRHASAEVRYFEEGDRTPPDMVVAYAETELSDSALQNAVKVVGDILPLRGTLHAASIAITNLHAN